MGYDRRGEQNRCSGWKLDDELQCPEDQVASLLGVEVTEGGDSAPTEGQVGAVAVAACDRAWSEVEGSGTPYAVGEVAL